MAPLAQDLGLTVDTSCDRDDPKCVRTVVDGYVGSGNILICWGEPPIRKWSYRLRKFGEFSPHLTCCWYDAEHAVLTDIVHKLGAGRHAPEYPEDRYDLICKLLYLPLNLLSSLNFLHRDQNPNQC